MKPILLILLLVGLLGAGYLGYQAFKKGPDGQSLISKLLGPKDTGTTEGGGNTDNGNQDQQGFGETIIEASVQIFDKTGKEVYTQYRDGNPIIFCQPEKGETALISVKANKSTVGKVLLLAQSGREISELKGVPATFEKNQLNQIPWNCKDPNTSDFLEEEVYLIIAQGEGGAESNSVSIIVPKTIESFDRERFIRENPWPEKIEFGLTAAKPSLETHTAPLVIPNEFKIGEITLSYLPVPDKIVIENSENLGGIVTAKVIGSSEPFELQVNTDFSEYFAQNKFIPKPVETKIRLEYSSGVPIFKNPPSISLKINLNEPGIILFKSKKKEVSILPGPVEVEEDQEKDELKDLLDEIAFKKGWELIEANQPEEDPLYLDKSQEEAISAKTVKKKINDYIYSSGWIITGPKEFKHLLIIGDNADIPFFDEEGVLGNDQEQVLDSAYYGNVDDDPFIELSIGRIPTSDLKQVKAYFEEAENRKNQQQSYAYIAGSGKIYSEPHFLESQGKKLDQEELNNASIRSQFLYTGFTPRFDDKSKGFLVSEKPGNETVFDDFSAECAFHAESFSSASYRACDSMTTFANTEFSLPMQFFSNIITFNKKLSETKEEKISGIKKAVPVDEYSLLPQNFYSSIGESFRDYLNVAIVSYKQKAYQALLGDPSNKPQTPANLFESTKKAFATLEGKKVNIQFPRLELNDLFFLGKDKPFTNDEIELIKQDRFAKANATILKTDYPFVTKAEKNKFLEYYVLLLDKDGAADKDDLYNDLIVLKRSDFTTTKNALKPSETKENILENQKSFNFKDFRRVALEIWSPTAQHAEILEAIVNDPDSPTSAGETSINGVDYKIEKIRLKATNDFYPNYTTSDGTIKITQNKDNTINVNGVLSGFEEVKTLTKARNNTKLLYFDSYKLVLENSQTKAKFNTPLFIVDNYAGVGDIQVNIHSIQVQDFSKYDTVSLHGVTSTFSDFDFLSKPILSAKIRGEKGKLLEGEIELKNELGFLEYTNSEITMNIYHREKEDDGTSEVLFEIVDVKNLAPLKEEPVFLVETKNASHPMLAGVKETVKEIFDQDLLLKNKFTNPDNVLLMYGGKSFYVIFTETAFFLSNGITLISDPPYTEYDFERVKKSLEGTQEKDINAAVVIEAPLPENVVGPPSSSTTPLDLDLHFFEENGKLTNDRLSFSFFFDDLLELVNKGAGDVPFYNIEISGFAESFGKTAEEQQVQQGEAATQPEVQEVIDKYGLTAQATRQFSERFIRVNNYNGLSGWFDKETKRIWSPAVQVHGFPDVAVWCDYIFGLTRPTISDFESIAISAQTLYGANASQNTAGVWPLFDRQLLINDYVSPSMTLDEINELNKENNNAREQSYYSNFTNSGTLAFKPKLTTFRNQIPADKHIEICISSPSLRITEEQIKENLTMPTETPQLEIRSFTIGSSKQDFGEQVGYIPVTLLDFPLIIYFQTNVQGVESADLLIDDIIVGSIGYVGPSSGVYTVQSDADKYADSIFSGTDSVLVKVKIYTKDKEEYESEEKLLILERPPVQENTAGTSGDTVQITKVETSDNQTVFQNNEPINVELNKGKQILVSFSSNIDVNRFKRLELREGSKALGIVSNRATISNQIKYALSRDKDNFQGEVNFLNEDDLQRVSQDEGDISFTFSSYETLDKLFSGKNQVTLHVLLTVKEKDGSRKTKPVSSQPFTIKRV